MGGCMGKESDEQRQAHMTSKDIEERVMNDYNNEKRIKKLLLLGAGESGKSTLFKQMVTIYGEGYSKEKLQTYQSIIQINIINAMKILIESSDILSNKVQGTKICDANQENKEFIQKIDDQTPLAGEVVEKLKALWNDSGIQVTQLHASEIQIPGSSSYFFEQLDRIGVADYEPTYDDVLRTRVRTTGIVETDFAISKGRFKIFDVGGQRNERKKQIHCFENVTAVLFVAALSVYDEKLYEDESIQRMTEALNLFDEISNSRQFRKTSIILFLNKVDIFKEKIMKTPLTVQFPEYDGPQNDWEAGAEYIQKKFVGLNRSADKQIYPHITCATDTNNIRHVFDAVTDIIIKQNLQQGGLLE